MAETLIVQGIVAGRERKREIDGKPQPTRRLAAIVLNQETGETSVIPVDKRFAARVEQITLGIDALRKLDPDLAEKAKRALALARPQKVKR